MHCQISPSKLDVANYLYSNTHDDKNGCWVWDGPLGTAGYGQTKYRSPSRGPEFAHRLAFATWVRPLNPGEYVLHHCDHKPCINPDHLCVGTQMDNIRDAIARGRFVMPPLICGEHSHLHKLSSREVREIRLSTKPNKELAERYGVTKGNILAIRAWRTWKHEACI